MRCQVAAEAHRACCREGHQRTRSEAKTSPNLVEASLWPSLSTHNNFVRKPELDCRP